LFWKWIGFAIWEKQYELCDFYDFLVFGRWNVHVYSTALICDLSVYIVEALELVCLVLIQLSQLFQSCKMIDELCRKWSLRLNAYKSFVNSLIWFYEDVWIIDRCRTWCLSWCDVLFSFVLIVRNCMKLLICGDVDVNMLNADCWWWIYMCLMLMLDMVIACI